MPERQQEEKERGRGEEEGGGEWVKYLRYELETHPLNRRTHTHTADYIGHPHTGGDWFMVISTAILTPLCPPHPWHI